MDVLASLFLGDHTGLQLVRHPGVVPSDLVNPVLMDVIGATIPYVGYEEPVALQDGGHQSSTHALLGGIGAGHGVDFGVGNLVGPPQALRNIGGGISVVLPEKRGDSLLAGHLAGCVPAYPVGHGVERAFP